MARCGCSQSCACEVTVADTESVDMNITGNGNPGSPYIINSDVVLLPDGEPPLAGANALKTSAGGLYVDEAGGPGGGGCAFGFNALGPFSVAVGDDVVALPEAPNGSQSGWLFPTATGEGQLPAGMWHVTGSVEIEFDDPATGYVEAEYHPTPLVTGVNPARGGKVTGGRLYVVAEAIVLLPFSGVVLQDAPWTPALTLTNITDVAATGLVTYHALGLASGCATTATVGGG
jgi:hypothetical protein